MREREPQKEIVGRGQLWYLHHPGTEEIFSGYGLTMEPNQKNRLAGILMVDRPFRADPGWLQTIYDAYGECQLVPMTAGGDRGLVCQMEIEAESMAHLRHSPSSLSEAIQASLEPLLDQPPAPLLHLSWDEEARAWLSEMGATNQLPREIRDVFEKTGYGCLAAETNIGIVHVCHASDVDIEGFRDKFVRSQWQLINMPTAPLIRLQLDVIDRPEDPYRFESFLNVAAEDQAQILAELANQEELHLAFYGDDLGYRYTRAIPHSEQQWQRLDELVAMANDYWSKISPERRDFDRAKLEFMRQFV
jgi:hypothetical protein